MVFAIEVEEAVHDLGCGFEVLVEVCGLCKGSFPDAFMGAQGVMIEDVFEVLVREAFEVGLHVGTEALQGRELFGLCDAEAVLVAEGGLQEVCVLGGQDGVFAGGFIFSQEFFGRVLIGRDGIVEAGDGGGEPAEAVLEEAEPIRSATFISDSLLCVSISVEVVVLVDNLVHNLQLIGFDVFLEHVGR